MLTLKSLGITTAIASAIAMPATAAAQDRDLRNPDQQFPATPAQTQDLRNADRRAAAPVLAQDLRNADRRAPLTVDPAPAEPSVVTAIEVPGDGFNWADAGIGAAGGLAILVILAGMVMAVTHRRHGPRISA